MSGKTIELYIDDSGLKCAELCEGNVSVYFGQRKVRQSLKKFSVSNCIYMLLNDSNENSEKKLYIGKTSNIGDRLEDHNKKKNWWTNFIIFESGKFEQTHLDYLEQKLCQIAKNNSIDTTIENIQKPKLAENIKITKQTQAENYYNDMQFLLNNLNIITLINKKDLIKEGKNDEIFYIKLKSPNTDKKAMMKIIDDKYVLLKGSYIEETTVPSVSENSSVDKNRKILVARKFIKKNQGENYYVVTEDITYNSPSLSASVVCGASKNGRITWKMENGKTIADIEES